MKYVYILIIFAIIAVRASEHTVPEVIVQKLQTLIDAIPYDERQAKLEETKRLHPKFRSSIGRFINSCSVIQEGLLYTLKIPGFLETMMEQTSSTQDLLLISEPRNDKNESLITLFMKNPEEYAPIAKKFFVIIEGKLETDSESSYLKTRSTNTTKHIIDTARHYITPQILSPFCRTEASSKMPKSLKYYDPLMLGTVIDLKLLI